MILAGKAYYDGVAKIGEIASGSPVSTELGELTIHFYKNLACCPRVDRSVSGGSDQEHRRELVGHCSLSSPWYMKIECFGRQTQAQERGGGPFLGL